MDTSWDPWSFRRIHMSLPVGIKPLPAPLPLWCGCLLHPCAVCVNLCRGPRSFVCKLSFFLSGSSFLPHHRSSQKFCPYYHLHFLTLSPAVIEAIASEVTKYLCRVFITLDFPVALDPKAASLQPHFSTRGPSSPLCLVTTPPSWASSPPFVTWSPPPFLLLLSLSTWSWPSASIFIP